MGSKLEQAIAELEVVRCKLLAKVKRENDCWIWQGSVLAGRCLKYGSMFVDGKNQRAHRVSWVLHNGPIPDGLFVCHKCDVPLCVNPDHLFLGTNQDNVNDKVAKGRSPSGKNEANPNARLTFNQVKEMREKYIPHRYSLNRLAKEYGVSAGHVSRIVNGIRWTEPKE
jgi:hypothetical protein